MEVELLLLANGFFLSILLIVLLVLLSREPPLPEVPSRKRVKDDLRKIKANVTNEKE